MIFLYFFAFPLAPSYQTERGHANPILWEKCIVQEIKGAVHIVRTRKNPILVGEFGEKVEKVDVAGLHRTLVDVIRADPSRPHGTLVLFR